MMALPTPFSLHLPSSAVLVFPKVMYTLEPDENALPEALSARIAHSFKSVVDGRIVSTLAASKLTISPVFLSVYTISRHVATGAMV
jgi:hypothetical protein